MRFAPHGFSRYGGDWNFFRKQGGLIVSMESGQQGNPLEWGVRRIYTRGASAGGLAAGALAYARSGYIAGDRSPTRVV